MRLYSVVRNSQFKRGQGDCMARNKTKIKTNTITSEASFFLRKSSSSICEMLNLDE